MLISDEVITSGYIPLVTLLNERVASAWEAEGPRSVVMHGYTYSGHPVACAAGLAAVDIAVNCNLAANAAEVGHHLRHGLRGLMDRHEAIGDVRGKGLMIAVELVKNRETREPFTPLDSYPGKVSDACLANGVMLRTIVNKFIISSPLILTKAHADQIASVFDHALSITSRRWWRQARRTPFQERIMSNPFRHDLEILEPGTRDRLTRRPAHHIGGQ